MKRGAIKNIIVLAVAFGINGCAETQFIVHGAKELIKTKKTATVAKTRGIYKIGKPYRIEKTWYYPAENFNYSETGVASWYGPNFHGKKTANGETFDMNILSAAHRTLPMPSAVRVLNLQNGRSLILRINDRGPFARGRIIDVSRRAAQLLGFHRIGTARVRVEIIADESQRLKLAALRGKIPINDRIQVNNVTNAPVERHSLTPAKPRKIKKRRSSGLSVPMTKEKKKVLPKVEKNPIPDNARLFIQAGAYIKFASASRVRSKLSEYGPAWLNEVQVGKQKFYRVRVGPIHSIDAADAVLSDIISAGFPKARLVID